MDDKEIEAKFISQEHRIIPIWLNFWVERKKWHKEDSRRKAASKAFALFWLPRPSTVIVSGGLIAIFSLYFMAKQTDLLNEQNSLIEKQNSLLLEQLKEQQTFVLNSRKTELIMSIYASNETVDDEVLYSKSIASTPPRIRSEALAEYLKLRRAEINQGKIEYRETGQMPVAATLNFGIDIRWAPLQGISISQLDMSRISLFHTNFQEAKLSYVNFSDSQMEYTNLANTDLTGANLKNTSLIGADLSYSNIQSIEWNNDTKILNANIYGVINAPPQFKEWALSHGALEFKNKEAWLEKNLSVFPALKKYITNSSKAMPKNGAL